MKTLLLLLLTVPAKAELRGEVRVALLQPCSFEYENPSGRSCREDYDAVRAAREVTVVAKETDCKFRFVARGEACRSVSRAPGAVAEAVLAAALNPGQDRELDGNAAAFLGLSIGDPVTLKTADVGRGYLVARADDGGHYAFLRGPAGVLMMKLTPDATGERAAWVLERKSPFDPQASIRMGEPLSRWGREIQSGRAVTAYKLYLLGL